MPQVPADQLPRLQQWWFSIGGEMQALLEAIYLDAPGAVSNALSGGAWVADSAEPGLTAQLGEADDLALLAQIAQLVSQPVVVTPSHAGLGQAITITWTEVNVSSVGMPDYVSDIYVNDAGQETIASARLPGTSIAAGASVDRSWTFDGVSEPGTYNVLVYTNAEGIEPNTGVASAQGFRTMTGGSFEAGSSEAQAQAQDEQLWATAIGRMTEGIAGDRFDEAALQEGVNWLVSIESIPEDLRPTFEDVAPRLAALRNGLAGHKERNPLRFDERRTWLIGLLTQGPSKGPADKGYLTQLADALLTVLAGYGD